MAARKSPAGDKPKRGRPPTGRTNQIAFRCTAETLKRFEALRGSAEKEGILSAQLFERMLDAYEAAATRRR